MTDPLTVSSFIDRLDAEGPLLAEAAESAGAEAPIPTCPGWAMRNLVHHVGGVHRWATEIVSTPRTEEWFVELTEVVGSWPGDAELIEWFREGHRRLVTALSEAPADLECFTFLPAPSSLLMWSRRQAHETTIHRIDAQSPTGTYSECDAEFAADGIDELLAGMLNERSVETPRGRAVTIHVRARDTGDDWFVRAGSGSIVTSREGSTADCSLSGRATDLYPLLWNRRGSDGITVEGDAALLDWWRESVPIP